MATPADKEQEKKIDMEEEVEAKEEMEEEVEECDEDEESVHGEDNDADADQEAEDAGDEKEVKAAPTPQQAVKAKKKQDDVLNLNNEVVRMRKDMKRVRALVIRKMICQIAALKKKKGKEIEVERNQRRAARLLEEIHAMKILVPDLVTKTALQKSLNFDKVCKNPKSTISDRAIARIATHPQFNKKIEQIKAAVKAFKEERMKGGKQGRKLQGQNEAEKSKLQSKGNDGKRGQAKEEKDMDIEKASIDTLSIEDKGNANISAVDVQEQKTPETETIKLASIKNSEVIEAVRSKPQNVAAETKPSLKPVPAVLQKKDVEAESDLESSSEEDEEEEEKEYFDDSTEERFHKQSSGSESDDDDDFFLGKVNKFKKKKKTSGGEMKQTQDVKRDTTGPLKTSDPIQGELDELESRLNSKATSLKSVFCSSLSGTKQSRGGGRGGNKFSKQRGGRDGTRDFSKPSKFQNQDKGEEGLKYNKPCPEDRRPDLGGRGFASAGRGRGQGRGRGDFTRQRGHRGGGVFSHQAPQQALHPSWEASKKRKEQQGQIQAFQGKKIKFDDD